MNFVLALLLGVTARGGQAVHAHCNGPVARHDSSPRDTSPLPATEKSALDDFYIAMGGPDWLVRAGWDTKSDPCGVPTWFGIKCKSNTTGINASESSTDHVISISLGDNHLDGTLPDTLSNLHLLEHLELSSSTTVARNTIRGGIPSTLCGLTQLSKLELRSTNISSTLPPCFAQLFNLESFDMSENPALCGPIPSMCELRRLKSIVLSETSLSGSLEDCISNCVHLKNLDMRNGPSLTGTIPLSLCSLSHLSVIHLDQAGLSGSLPFCLGNNQDRLAKVTFQYNSLDGSIPESLCSSRTSLQEIDVGNNALTG